MTIVSELSRLVGQHHLLEVSETEQHLVCQGDHNEVVQVREREREKVLFFQRKLLFFANRKSNV